MPHPSQFQFDQNWKMRLHTKAEAAKQTITDIMSDLNDEEELLVVAIMLSNKLGKYTQGMRDEQRAFVISATLNKVQECYFSFYEAYRQGKLHD